MLSYGRFTHFTSSNQCRHTGTKFNNNNNFAKSSMTPTNTRDKSFNHLLQ